MFTEIDASLTRVPERKQPVGFEDVPYGERISRFVKGREADKIQLVIHNFSSGHNALLARGGKQIESNPTTAVDTIKA